MKITIPPRYSIHPQPVVLITCTDGKGKHNIVTIACIINLSRSIPHIGFVMHRGSYSSKLIEKTREFGVNIPSEKSLQGVDICGETHGNQVDKVKLSNFSLFDSELIKPKLINECLINFECKLKKIYEIEESNLFIGEIVRLYVDENVSAQDGKFDLGVFDPIIYAEKTYFSLGKKLGNRGISSVSKK